MILDAETAIAAYVATETKYTLPPSVAMPAYHSALATYFSTQTYIAGAARESLVADHLEYAAVLASVDTVASSSIDCSNYSYSDIYDIDGKLNTAIYNACYAEGGNYYTTATTSRCSYYNSFGEYDYDAYSSCYYNNNNYYYTTPTPEATGTACRNSNFYTSGIFDSSAYSECYYGPSATSSLNTATISNYAAYLSGLESVYSEYRATRSVRLGDSVDEYYKSKYSKGVSYAMTQTYVKGPAKTALYNNLRYEATAVPVKTTKTQYGKSDSGVAAGRGGAGGRLAIAAAVMGAFVAVIAAL